MKFENIRVYNFEHALRGMRNPKESYHLIDSEFGIAPTDDVIKYCAENDCDVWDVILYTSNNYSEYAVIGPNDMKLARGLISAGSEHRKFLRQIFVTVDITAPLYWWKEFDTYKVATVANSTSTMHTIHKTPISIESFETDDYHPELELIDPAPVCVRVENFIDDLEQLRQMYLNYMDNAKNETDPIKKEEYKTIAKQYWKELIRWTPNGWKQTRTVTLNYETLLAMCSKGQRRFHKLNEWSGIDDNMVSHFIRFARQLPYAKDFLFIDETNN